MSSATLDLLFKKDLLNPIFDRQMRIPDWDQSKIEQQVCLCLGVGGLGSTVSMALCRLGVKKIYLLDFDVVDSHNLNRQTLFSKEDIGKSKVKCAIDALKTHIVGNTELVPMELDAVKQWGDVVKAIKDCNVVFNMIDVGDYWDLAVQSLCLKYQCTFVSGGTFQNTVTVDFSNAKKGRACWGCMSDVQNGNVIAKLVPDLIETYASIDFIPRQQNPIGASNVFVACLCAHLMVDCWIQELIPTKEVDEEVPGRFIFCLSTFDCTKWVIPSDDKCPLKCSNYCK